MFDNYYRDFNCFKFISKYLKFLWLLLIVITFLEDHYWNTIAGRHTIILLINLTSCDFTKLLLSVQRAFGIDFVYFFRVWNYAICKHGYTSLTSILVSFISLITLANLILYWKNIEINVFFQIWEEMLLPFQCSVQYYLLVCHG